MNKLKELITASLDRVLPETVKRSIFHLSFHLAREEFDQYAYEVNFAPHMALGLAAVARRGLLPRTIVDVGAFQGGWSKMARSIWPQSRLIMVEPNLSKQTALARLSEEMGASVYGELLGAEDGVGVPFNVMGTGSSVFNERSPLDRTTENRHLSRLDSIVRDVDQPVFLKIDAQGYELEVLKGTTRLLDVIDAILLEVAVIEINEGAPLLDEVIAYMRGIGFVTYDILEIHRRPLDQALNQVDILFVRPDSALLQDKRHFA